MSKVAAIVYGEQSGIHRRLIVTDEGIYRLAGHYGPGESIIILDASEVLKNGAPSLDQISLLIEAKRGKRSDADRVVVIDIDSGDIEKIIRADPIIDTLPGKVLFQHTEADVGWVLDTKGEFVPPPPKSLSEEDLIKVAEFEASRAKMK